MRSEEVSRARPCLRSDVWGVVRLVGAGAGARHEVTLEDVEQSRGEGWAGTLLWQQGGRGHDQH